MQNQKIAAGIATVMLAVLLGGCGTSEISRPESNYQTVPTEPGGDTKSAIENNRRGLELLKAGNINDAEAAFKAALEADVSYGPAHNNLGSLYYQNGELYLAAWEFRYAAKLMPDDARPNNNLAMVYQAAGKDKKVLESFTKAHQIEPKAEEITISLIKTRLKQNLQDAETRSLLNQLIEQSKDDTTKSWAIEQLAQLESTIADK